MSEQVSFDDEPLILVDQNDVEIGNLSKEDCHLGDGKLHRAFSIFIINCNGEILLQQRSSQKKLWPNYWSNSCCSHPRKGESINNAAHRRLQQELNLHSELRELYQFEYKAQYKDIGTEHELCTVYFGASDETVVVNKNEISDWCWLLPREIDELLSREDKPITPWFKLEWEALNRNHPEFLKISD